MRPNLTMTLNKQGVLLLSLFLAACSDSDGQRAELYLSDDLYMYNLQLRQPVYTSKAIVNGGYNFISYTNEYALVSKLDCSMEMYELRNFSTQNPKAWRLGQQSIEAMSKASREDTKRLLDVAFDGLDTTIKWIVGYQEPKYVNTDGFNITVLAPGHCVVASWNFKPLGFERIIINDKTMTKQWSQKFDGGRFSVVGRHCTTHDDQTTMQRVGSVVANCGAPKQLQA